MIHVNNETLTRVIEQRLVLAFLGGCDQIPDEALDLVVTFVVSQAVNQQSPASPKTETLLNIYSKELINDVPGSDPDVCLLACMNGSSLPVNHFRVSVG